MSPIDPTAPRADFEPVRNWTSAYVTDLRECAGRVHEAFANYVNGTGLDAWYVATVLPAILDELERVRLTPRAVDEATLKTIVEDFDALAKKRAAELLRADLDDHLRGIYESAFCLGYKAGVVDLSATQRAK